MLPIKPYVFVPEKEEFKEVISKLARYGRVCYQSESDKKKSDEALIASIITSGHESVIEHEKITVIGTVDRGITHEAVRHRIASFSQESTRYCDYSKGKFGGEIRAIEPFFFVDSTRKNAEEMYLVWYNAMCYAENSYLTLLKLGATAQEARTVLPNSLKAEIVITYNLREWRHFFKLRCAKSAHPQMRQFAIPLLLHFRDILPVIFSNVPFDTDFKPENYAKIREDARL